MPNFRYQAKDRTGKSMAGVIEASDSKAAADVLRKQDLIIIAVNPEKSRTATLGKPRKGGGKVKLTELVMFSRQIATMIDSGIPLMQSLEILSEQIENKSFKTTVSELKKSVATGSSFYEALAKHPRTFNPLFINMAKAGESSGALDDIMDRLASYLEKTDSLIRKVKSAMIYPIVVSSMAFIITMLMMLKVVPVFKDMFNDFGGKLPLPTQILIAISDALTKYFVIWFSLMVGGIILFIQFIRTQKGAMVFDRFKLRVPIFGMIIRKVAVSKFSRTLATLVKSGVPILSALEIVGKTAGNKVVEQAVEKVRNSIREGESISEPLMRSGVFPPMVVRMIAVGEQTGELEKMLSKIADFYDDQVDASVSGLTSLIEPLIIAFLGIVIGGIVICMFMPLFALSSLVSA